MEPVLSKRSFQRHVTKAIKHCQIEEKKREENAENESGSAGDEDERNINHSQISESYCNISDRDKVPEQDHFYGEFFIGQERICILQFSEYNTFSNNSEKFDGSEKDENVLSEKHVHGSCSSMSYSTNDVKKILS